MVYKLDTICMFYPKKYSMFVTDNDLTKINKKEKEDKKRILNDTLYTYIKGTILKVFNQNLLEI